MRMRARARGGVSGRTYLLKPWMMICLIYMIGCLALLRGVREGLGAAVWTLAATHGERRRWRRNSTALSD